MRRSLVLPCLVLLTHAGPAPAAADPLRDQAAKALRKAAEFFRTRVATEGGYLWRYSEDLRLREGEGKAGATTVWVQPPGTPSVGMAYLAAFDATGERYYLAAARAAARALVKGQLRSGGWTYRIEFDPADRQRHAYRTDREGRRKRNVTTFDDDTTQAALRLLMRVDKALGFKDEAVHEAAAFALDCVLKAQYPNGAWPQGYNRFPDPKEHPVRKASYPESWPRTPPKADYWLFCTLNDNVLADLVETLLEAEYTYGGGKYRAAVERAGGFLLLAQMPEPQPAWAQQYDFEMRPVWARKFEPPSITGGESQRAMQTLLVVYQVTGDRKYLEPIPKALKFLERSRLSDGRLARFYELKTNRPLYFTRKYELTCKDDDLPTHYAFKVSQRLDRIAKEHERLASLKPEKLRYPPPPPAPAVTPALVRQVKEVIGALDERGRWAEEGRLRSQPPDDPNRRVIECRTFIRNVEVLAAYLKASRP